jgi:Domain of unknown function (DUF4129)
VESRPRPLPIAIAVGLLLFVVALASRPDAGQLQPDIGGQAASVAVDTLFYLFLLASLAGLLIIAWALWPNQDMDLPAPERSRWPVLLAVLSSLAVVALVWWRARGGSFPGLPSLVPGGAAGGPLGGTGRGPLASHGTDWPALLITAAVVVLTGSYLWRQWRPLRRRPGSRRFAGGELDDILDNALDDLVNEQDPRQAVIEAWDRMERLLAAQGLPRRPAEAPFEYAARAFAELGLPAAGLDEFAWLFEWARFSLNEVTATMREEALATLIALREGIRVAA